MPGEGVEPTRLAAEDLKSSASAIPPPGQLRRRPESNRRISLLQRDALPLGYGAILELGFYHFNPLKALFQP